MHIKSISAPKSWPIERKGEVYLTRPKPGPHSISESISLCVLLRDILGNVKTAKEARKVVHEKKVSVNGKIVKSIKLPVGLFDVLSFSDHHFRVLLNKSGKLFVKPISKNELIKVTKIVNKTAIGKKIQVTLSDGNNLLLEKPKQKVGDSLVLSIPKNEIKDTLEFAKESLIFLKKGAHVGDIGKIKDILGKKIVYDIPGKGAFETIKENVIVIGKDKPVINLNEK
ncbi:30S ribosomal protein S4e [Nanoarchaeota archaeon]